MTIDQTTTPETGKGLEPLNQNEASLLTCLDMLDRLVIPGPGLKRNMRRDIVDSLIQGCGTLDDLIQDYWTAKRIGRGRAALVESYVEHLVLGAGILGVTSCEAALEGGVLLVTVFGPGAAKAPVEDLLRPLAGNIDQVIVDIDDRAGDNGSVSTEAESPTHSTGGWAAHVIHNTPEDSAERVSKANILRLVHNYRRSKEQHDLAAIELGNLVRDMVLSKVSGVRGCEAAVSLGNLSVLVEGHPSAKGRVEDLVAPLGFTKVAVDVCKEDE